MRILERSAGVADDGGMVSGSERTVDQQLVHVEPASERDQIAFGRSLIKPERDQIAFLMSLIRPGARRNPATRGFDQDDLEDRFDVADAVSGFDRTF